MKQFFQQDKYKLIGIGVILICLCAGFLYIKRENRQIADEVKISGMNETVQQEEEEQSNEIYVDIKGAVNKVGVYAFEQGERVKDAVEKAGGFRDDANLKSVNLAQLLEDEMVLYIPKNGEETDEEIAIEGVGSTSKDGKINVNKADSNELQTIPGIGPSKAGEIIAYREQNGPFKTVEDLQNVSGIGEKTVEKLKQYVIVK
ncbi:MAG: helix-hairpin-helix domain-containing protein [Bacillaceae bacterium]